MAFWLSSDGAFPRPKIFLGTKTFCVQNVSPRPENGLLLKWVPDAATRMEACPGAVMVNVNRISERRRLQSGRRKKRQT